MTESVSCQPASLPTGITNVAPGGKHVNHGGRQRGSGTRRGVGVRSLSSDCGKERRWTRTQRPLRGRIRTTRVLRGAEARYRNRMTGSGSRRLPVDPVSSRKRTSRLRTAEQKASRDQQKRPDRSGTQFRLAVSNRTSARTSSGRIEKSRDSSCGQRTDVYPTWVTSLPQTGQ
jgi:hypothetical protein